MDALDLLEQQHNDVGALLDKTRVATQAAERSALAAQIATILVAHSRAEVRHVYAACANRLRRDDAQRFDRACARQAKMREAAMALARGRLSESVFRARLDRLREIFLEHELDDERWIFQRSKCSFTDEELDVLGMRIASASPIPPAMARSEARILSASRERQVTRSLTVPQRALDRDRATEGAEEAGDPNADHRRA